VERGLKKGNGREGGGPRARNDEGGNWPPHSFLTPLSLFIFIDMVRPRPRPAVSPAERHSGRRPGRDVHIHPRLRRRPLRRDGGRPDGRAGAHRPGRAGGDQGRPGRRDPLLRGPPSVWIRPHHGLHHARSPPGAGPSVDLRLPPGYSEAESAVRQKRGGAGRCQGGARPVVRLKSGRDLGAGGGAAGCTRVRGRHGLPGGQPHRAFQYVFCCFFFFFRGRGSKTRARPPPPPPSSFPFLTHTPLSLSCLCLSPSLLHSQKTTRTWT